MFLYYQMLEVLIAGRLTQLIFCRTWQNGNMRLACNDVAVDDPTEPEAGYQSIRSALPT